MWDSLFAATNLVALLAWAALIVLPRRPMVSRAVMFCGVGLLCLVYSAALFLMLTGAIDPNGASGGGFTTIADIRAIFASDAGVVIGWTHYLAFDLFVGLWIAREADRGGVSRWFQAPILLATLMAGPLGLLVWLVARTRLARRAHRRP